MEKTMSESVLMQHYRALEAMYLSAPLNRFYEPTIYVEHQASEISVQVEEKFFHAGGAMHGSIYFKMLDDAAFFAANSVESTFFVLTADFRIDLLRPCTGGLIRSKGTIVRAGRQDILAEAKLFDEQDRLLATGIGRFSRGRNQLMSLECYVNVFNQKK
jgi:uncharacterized protein (TIGR00369 family)